MKNKTYLINGVECRHAKPDYDGDGRTGNVEVIGGHAKKVNSDYDAPPTELGESLNVLMDDNIENDTRMSGIDMRSNLHEFQTTNLSAFDAFVAFGLIPRHNLFLSRQIKRLACSVKGWRAQQIVDTVTGKRESDKEMGMRDKFNNFMGMG